MLDKTKLIELGLKHHFLNWVDHETPRSYFPWPRDCYTDVEDIDELYNLLCEIYAEVGIV